MNPTPNFPASSSETLANPPSHSQQRAPGTLHEYFFELAAKSIQQVDPIPPALRSSPCALGGAQDNNREPVGSPYLCDWATDVRETYRLTDAELVDKMRWELEALKKRERLQRTLEVPTVYPEAK